MPEQISSECSVHCTLTKEKGGCGYRLRWVRVTEGEGKVRERREARLQRLQRQEMMGDGLEAELWMHRRASRWTFE